MKIFLAATSHIHWAVDKTKPPVFLLESFMDLKSKGKKKQEYIKWCLTAKEFLLDSGAFAFMKKTKFNENFDYNKFDEYVEDYINFINKWDIKYFFEMDIDHIVGYQKVLEYRKKIEKETGKKVIPVYHSSRGMEEFYKMCREYEYIAIGGIAVKGGIEDRKKVFDLCDIAHSYGCKIHGLGFLPLSLINSDSIPFDTIDGTSWQSHIRGKEYYLDNGKLQTRKTNKHWKDIEYNNFNIWNQVALEKYKKEKN